MDGALRPDARLDEAAVVCATKCPDDLARDGDGVIFSSGADALRLLPESGTTKLLRRFDAPIACLASADGAYATGLEDGRICVWREGAESAALREIGGKGLVCPTALAFDGPSTLVVCQGSARNAPRKWRHDLMQREASGSVWRVSLPDGAARLVADRLAFPYGVVVAGADLIVSESWRHRLVRLSHLASPTPVLADLPGYPARLSAREDGGYWLAVFAPRSQLIEFVLHERAYRERMMREIAPDYWLAPSLLPPRNFLEPMQGGALRMHSILKPWAPTRSYGLVIRLDDRFRPMESFHSRTDGRRHGVTACLDWGDGALAASKGGDAILRLTPRAERA
jgi:hypothetical protein